MKIFVNGNLIETPENTTIAKLIEDLGYRQPNIAVEINQVLCPRSKYGQTKITPEMKIEIVAFVGGG